jgi:8-oxo-dGTP diphosphatase
MGPRKRRCHRREASVRSDDASTLSPAGPEASWQDRVMPFTPIMGTLAYVVDRSRDRVLMVHRTARSGDEQFGKYNGLGGKLEADEDVVTCIRREVLEEAGIELTSLALRGTISWPGFGPNGEDWFGFVFLADEWLGEPLRENVEGTLDWVPLDRVLTFDLPMWEGDVHFLPLVFDDDPRPFHGVMPYSTGRPVGWSFVRL